MDPNNQQPDPAPDAHGYSVPWRPIDNWIGVALLVLIGTVVAIIMLQAPRTELVQSAAVVLLESAYLLPVVLIFAWRRIHWKDLGFGKFEWKTLGIGCGLLVASYAIIMLHGALLYYLGVETQGEAIMKLLAQLDSPVWFFIVIAVFAPFVEEVFFRGFLFQGFRQKYGWTNAMLVSSAVFAAAHLDLAVLIPTFIMGCVLAYVYHKSNSVWPGVILHSLNNAFGFCAIYFAMYFQDSIPL